MTIATLVQQHCGTTVKLSIPPGGLSLEELEEQISETLKEAGRDLLPRSAGTIVQQACKQMEQQVESDRGLRRVKRRGLHLLTRFGWIRLRRWQVRDEQGRYCYPMNGLLGLQPRQHASPWILDRSVSLATRIPYRQATYLLGTFVDEPLDHRTLYRWVQATGAKIIEEEDELQEAVFRDGVVLPRPDEER